MGKISNILGKKYNRLTVVEKLDKRKNGRVLWLCECECGGFIETYKSNLDKGDIKSCGCLAKEIRKDFIKNSKKHGLSRSRLYDIHRHIKNRCYNKNDKSYSFYGEKGIKICDEWSSDEGFIVFYNWSMENGYKENLTLDRIDNSRNYEPNNCRWVDMKTQANNRSNNTFVYYQNKKYTLSEFEHKYGISQRNLSKLIKNYTIDEILIMYSCIKTKDLASIMNLSVKDIRLKVKNNEIVPFFISKNGNYYFKI